jgi:DNA-binding transcriptional ArsR family regulator
MITTLSDVFHALAPPARPAILDELHDQDGQTLFELCTRLTIKHELGLSRQAISQHLEVLEAAGLVSSRREGRYQVSSPRHHAAEGRRAALVDRGPKRRPKQ